MAEVEHVRRCSGQSRVGGQIKYVDVVVVVVRIVVVVELTQHW